MAYLKFRVPFFHDYKKGLLKTLIEKLKYRVYDKGESMMNQGEIGDCMFIVYSGEYGVYIFQKKKSNSFE